MKNKKLQKLLKKNKSNFGFTLTELLVGLIMSTIVVAGLGWGLINILRATSTETTRSTARNETSRAFTFVADEVKAAQFMEVDMGDFNIGNVAPNYSKPSGGTVRLALIVPGVQQRIIYSIAPKPSGSVWKGPLVIYRWGPNLNADGSYSDPNTPGSWTNEPLIDNVSDADQTVACGGNDITYKGFFACVLDNDDDGTAETNPAIDFNKDGQIKLKDGEKDGDDIDGLSITAQLYFAGKTDSQADNGVYLADSQVVARARIQPETKDEFQKPSPVYFESLPSNYDGRGCLKVRNDFGQGTDPRFDPNSTVAAQKAKALKDIMTWVHEDNRQSQPLNIDTTKPFTIVASAFDNPDPDLDTCNAKGNKYKQKLVSIQDDGSGADYQNVDANGNVNANAQELTNGKEAIHTYKNKVWHTLEFPNVTDSPAERNRKLATFNGDSTGKVGDGIYMFQNGNTVPDKGGYDVNGDGVYTPGVDQPSIRQFLQEKRPELLDSNGNVIGLKGNQRIVAFEMGQTDPTQPGFDYQDNMFIMTSDALGAN